MLRHLHEFSGNQNVLSFNGRQYVWNWMRFLGGKHTLMDAETKEVVAVGALQFTFAWQWVTAWGFRYILYTSPSLDTAPSAGQWVSGMWLDSWWETSTR